MNFADRVREIVVVGVQHDYKLILLKTLPVCLSSGEISSSNSFPYMELPPHPTNNKTNLKALFQIY